jgi:hypothetical protein
METQLPEFLTTDELADLLRTTPETCRYWRHVGKGPSCFRIGRRVLYAKEDVTLFLARAQAEGIRPALAPAVAPSAVS